MSTKTESNLEFETVSNQVFIYKGDLSKDNNGSSKTFANPNVIIIYGWGDGSLKHVSKYASGYHVLFPRSKIITVLSSILQTMTVSLDQRVRNMVPVVEEAFRSKDDSAQHPSPVRRTILMHVMSNTGGMNLGATFEAYRRMYNSPMPHNLLVFDSTPGSTTHTPANVRRFAFAMTVGTAAWFPWPRALTQWMWFFFLYVIRGLEILVGRESAANFALKAMNDEVYATRAAPRLYLYSKEDAIINWKDIESNAVTTVSRGYQVDRKLFKGSAHVGHMRKWPEEYWKAILQAWVDRDTSDETISVESKDVVESANLSTDI